MAPDQSTQTNAANLGSRLPLALLTPKRC